MASNTLITPDMIARESLEYLQSNLVMAKTVYRGHEKEWLGRGFKVGDTVSYRRPVQYTIRSGKTASIQDTTEGKLTTQVNNQKGIDFEFDSDELTLDIEEFGQRYLKNATSRIAHQVDIDLMGLYTNVPSWVGTPGEKINSYPDFSAGIERLDELNVPMEERYSVLAPADYHALAANQTTLGSSDRLVESAYERAKLPRDLGGVEVFMSQQVPNHTRGSAAGTILVDGASQGTTYAASKDANSQTLNVDGLTSGTAFAAGDVITLDGVYAVNPATGETLDFLRQFTVTAASATSSGNTDDIALTITPAIITSGAYKTCSAEPANNAAVTVVGSVSTNYRQNMVYHKNAFGLVMVPMIKDLPGAECYTATDEQTGLSIRYAKQYDISNDKVVHRLDVLYAVTAVDNRLATRISGAA
jgi:hypothetical protein